MEEQIFELNDPNLNNFEFDSKQFPSNEEELKTERRTQALLKTIAYNQKILNERNEKSPFYFDKNTRTTQVIPSWGVSYIVLPNTENVNSFDIFSSGLQFPFIASPFVDQKLKSNNKRIKDDEEEDEEERPRRKDPKGAEECRICSKKQKFTDELIYCSKCKSYMHASCLQLPKATIKKIKTYDWTCENCTVCTVCNASGDESTLLLCDGCDRGFHSLCLTPPLHTLPSGGWKCAECVYCTSCGEKESNDWKNNYTTCENCFNQISLGMVCCACQRAVYGDKPEKGEIFCVECQARGNKKRGRGRPPKTQKKLVLGTTNKKSK